MLAAMTAAPLRGFLVVISAKSVAFGAHCVKEVEDIPKLFCNRNIVQSF